MLVTHSLALAIWPIRRFRIDGAMAPSLHFWCRRRKRTAEEPSRRAAASVIRYLFDSDIITMRRYHGNQQKGHIAKA